MMLVAVKRPRHNTHFRKLPNLSKTLRKCLIISPDKIKLTSKHNSWWILLQNFVTGPPREQLVIFLLIVKISGVQLEQRCQHCGMTSPEFFKISKFFEWRILIFVGQHGGVNEDRFDLVKLVSLCHKICSTNYDPATATSTCDANFGCVNSILLLVCNDMID